MADTLSRALLDISATEMTSDTERFVQSYCSSPGNERQSRLVPYCSERKPYPLKTYQIL